MKSEDVVRDEGVQQFLASRGLVLEGAEKSALAKAEYEKAYQMELSKLPKRKNRDGLYAAGLLGGAGIGAGVIRQQPEWYQQWKNSQIASGGGGAVGQQARDILRDYDPRELYGAHPVVPAAPPAQEPSAIGQVVHSLASGIQHGASAARRALGLGEAIGRATATPELAGVIAAELGRSYLREASLSKEERLALQRDARRRAREDAKDAPRSGVLVAGGLGVAAGGLAQVRSPGQEAADAREFLRPRIWDKTPEEYKADWPTPAEGRQAAERPDYFFAPAARAAAKGVGHVYNQVKGYFGSAETVPVAEQAMPQQNTQARDAMALRRGFGALPPQVQRQLLAAMKKRRAQAARRPTMAQQQQMHRAMQQSGMLSGVQQF